MKPIEPVDVFGVLKPKERQALELRILDGLTWKNVAKEMGVCTIIARCWYKRAERRVKKNHAFNQKYAL